MHDVKVAWQIPFPVGIVGGDYRECNDWRVLAYWTDSEVSFVTRMKDNAQFEVVQVPHNRRIVHGQTIRLRGAGAQEKCARRDLNRWLDEPYTDPPDPQENPQVTLAFA